MKHVGCVGLMITAVLIGVAPARAQAPPRSGFAGAVIPDTRGALPGSSDKLLEIGNDVYLDEQIRTDRNGRTQLIFLDHSRISIARDTEITLNRFIFDPTTGTGQMTASLGPGLVRATASPLCSHQGSAMQISVHSGAGRQTGVVELRGGKTAESCPIVLMRVQPNGSASIIQLAGGVVQVTGTAGPPTTIMRPGFAVELPEEGSAQDAGRAQPQKVSDNVKELNGSTPPTGDSQQEGQESGGNQKSGGISTISSQTSVSGTYLSEEAFRRRRRTEAVDVVTYSNVNASILHQLEAEFIALPGGLLGIPLEVTLTTLSAGSAQKFSIRVSPSGELTVQPSLAALTAQLNVASSAIVAIASLGINRTIPIRR